MAERSSSGRANWLKLYRQYRQNGLSRAEAKKETETVLGDEPEGAIKDAEAKPAKKVEKLEKYSVEVRICKIERKLGLVLGWGIICKRNGEDYYDLHDDHCPEPLMLSSSADFMASARIMSVMHKNEDGEVVEKALDVEKRGEVVFAFPLTTEIAKIYGIESSVTGLMIAAKPDVETLDGFESGKYTGFSLGGYGAREEVAA